MKITDCKVGMLIVTDEPDNRPESARILKTEIVRLPKDANGQPRDFVGVSLTTPLEIRSANYTAKDLETYRPAQPQPTNRK